MTDAEPTQIHATGDATGFIPAPPSDRGKFPARLHVLLARDAKVGLVI